MTTALKISKLTNLAVIIFYTLLAFLLIKPLFAQDSTISATSDKKILIQQKIEARKEAVQAKVETSKEKVQIRIASKEANIKQKIEDRKEKIASRHAALKEKLQTFKDKKKAEIAETVNTNLNRINTNQTDRMLKHLNTISTILDKVENLVNQGNSSIKDPDATRVAIEDARIMIISTSDVVTEQSGKDYTIELTSESKVKADAQTQRKKLHNDLLAVRKLVIESKQKVTEVIRTAKAEKGAKEATTSGQQ